MPDVRNEVIDNLQIRGAIGGGKINALRQAISVAMTSSTSSDGICVPSTGRPQWEFSGIDFSIACRDAIAWSTAAKKYLVNRQVNTGTNGSNIVCASGILQLEARDTSSGANVVFCQSTQAVPVADMNAALIVFVAVLDGLGGATGYWYCNGAQLGASVAISSTNLGYFWSGLSDSNLFRVNRSPAAAAENWVFYDRVIYNRALTAAEVLSLYNNGPALADLGASQTLLVSTGSSNFEGGTVGSWVQNASGATVAVNSTTPIAGTYDLIITATGSSASGACIPISITNGKRYRITFSYKAASGAWVTGVRDTTGATSAIPATDVTSPTITADGTVRTATYAFTATSTQTAYFHIRKSSETSLDTINVDTFVYVQTGVTGWWNAADAQSNAGQMFDRSGNKNHALLLGTGSRAVCKPTADLREVRGTTTWTASTTARDICGFDQAVLPSNAYIESIVGVVSGATVEDITIGDGSDADRFVTITTGLAAGTVAFTLANRTTDGTNLKLKVTPDASATMTISWTITYRVLE